MRDGSLYRVDWYFVVQKMMKPKTNLYLDKSTTQTKLSIGEKLTEKRKSVCQVITKVASIVTGCPWHERTPSSIVFLPKTSKESNPELDRKFEESRVVRE